MVRHVLNSRHLIFVFTIILFCQKELGLLSNIVVANAFSLNLDEEIVVWDNILSESNRELLHSTASASGLGHKLFSRPLVDSGHQAGIIERTLDAILTEMGETANETNTQYVEYWTRQEWRHIEAHADVDENLAKEEDLKVSMRGGFRYPKNGHVLYLKIGSEVHGPTCIFPGQSNGGDLVEDKADNKNVEIVTVPAVAGRLLRFKGSLLHSVPRPADLWFLSFVKGAPNFTPEEKYGRSVILFNTWDGNEAPPKDVPFDDGKCNEDYKGPLCNSFLDWNLTFKSSTTKMIENGKNEKISAS